MRNVGTLLKEYKEGYTVTNKTTGKKTFVDSIPTQLSKLETEKRQLELRRTLLKQGTITENDFKKFELQVKNLELEVNGNIAKFDEQRQAHLDVISGKSGRLVSSAQFTLYTQHEEGKEWKPEEVKKYTDFLLKVEKAIEAAGVAPVAELPASDAPVPGLKYATFRDEGIGDAAERRALKAKDTSFNYQQPPASLIQEYRDSPFFKLAAQQVASANEVRVTV